VRVLVIPSNREKYLCEFLAAWEGKGGWDSVIVVEDGPTKTFGNYSWAEIAKECGDDAWIFSRKDSAIRAFGFLMAWRWTMIASRATVAISSGAIWRRWAGIGGG
jgi:hypothetical protein